MTTVAVTCIKNGRHDSFGRPLVAGTTYPAINRELARSLWQAGFVSVADESVFDDDPLAATSPLDDFNVARTLAISRQPTQTGANLAAELGVVQQAFIIGGQSNADGRGSTSSLTPESPAVWMLDKGESYRRASEPLGVQSSGWINNIPVGSNPSSPAHSFGVMMGKEICRQTGIMPILVPCAVGSTTFTHWLKPSGALDMTTLFGALILRAQKAQREGITPVFVWYGQEANASGVTVTNATGVVNTTYLWQMDTLVRQVREYFPAAPFLFCQLSAHNDFASHEPLFNAGEVQRRMHDAGGVAPRLFTTADMTPVNVNGTNVITIQPDAQFHMAGDGSTSMGVTVPVEIGSAWEMSITVTGTGAFKVLATDQQHSALTAGSHVLSGTTTGATLGIYRNQSGQATDLTFTVNYMRSANSWQLSNAFMAVTHDVPRNASTESIHVSAEGQLEIGRRLALLYAEKVLKLPGIDGTGPRLVSVANVSGTQTRVTFSQTVAAAKAGETNYSDGVNSLFRVYDGGTERSVSAVVVDSNPAALLITHATCSGVRVVTYGNRAGQDAAWRKGVVYNTTLPLPLPAPQFVATSV